MSIATLVLEDGTVLSGSAFGADADAVFELVFNTSMSGYQEIITDPSYRGQGVLFTAAHIGNVGINPEDYESGVPQVSAVVLHSLSPIVSNWRATLSLDEWLAAHAIPAIHDLDTRYLTRKLRQSGTMKAALSTRGTPAADLLAMARAWPGLDGRDMVGEVTCAAPWEWQGDRADHWVQLEQPALPGRHIVAMDFGVKRNILRCLAASGAHLTIVPAYSRLDDLLSLHPDGIFLSNGPGDPAGLPGIVDVVRALIQLDIPTFGICLGQQLIGRALSGDTQRLKFGHHSGNHPVQHLATGKASITSQNHNYTVRPATLDPEQVEITHLSLNDGSLEGFRLRKHPVFCVQFHPEASPGPHDAFGFFAQFGQLIASQPASILV